MGKHKYIEDENGKNTWQTPAETDKRGGGDCEDLAIHKFDQLKKQGKDPWMIWGERDGKSHMWVEDGGEVVDFMDGGERNEQIRFNDQEYIRHDGKKGNAMGIRKWKDVNGRMG